MRRPKLLDLFCCEGGAAVGYERAGFDVYGVDVKARRRYPFPIHTGDALTVLDRVALHHAGIPFTHGDGHVEWLLLDDFDAIHASPPCQRYSQGTVAGHAHKHPDLIAPTRRGLIASGLPYVIENVERAPLIDAVVFCGTEFQLTAKDDDGTLLEMWRHRLFESNVPLARHYGHCEHGRFSDQVAGSYGGARRDKKEAREIRHGGYVPSKAVQERLLGIDWMTQYGLYQSVPPVYTQWIGQQLAKVLRAAA